MATYEIKTFGGGLSDFEDRGALGSFKFASNLDIRKKLDSLSAGQALKDIGTTINAPSSSLSPSASASPSSSLSPSISPSVSPSASVSPSILTSPSASQSPSASRSPSASNSPSASISPSSSVSPSPSPSAGLHTVFADLIKWWVKCSDGFVYGFGNTGKVYKINMTDFSCYQVYDCQKEIKGAEEKPSSSGKTYLAFATNTEVHIKEIPGLSNWNDVDKVNGYPKQNLDSADYHTMKQVAGDVHIANGSKLAFIGYDDSYTNEALQLIPGNLAKTIVERQGRAIIGTVRASDPTKGINAAIDTEVPLAQVGSNGELYYANMVDSIPVKRFPGGGKVNPAGVCNEVEQVNFFEWEVNALSWIGKQVIGNLALFGVYAADTGKGGIYSYGRKDKNHLLTLNLDHQLDVDEIGALVTGNGTTMLSYRSGSSFGVMIVDANNKATAIYEGLDFRAPVKVPSQISVWNTAELFMKPLPTGTKVQFWYRLNKTGNFVQAQLADQTGHDFTSANSKKAVFLIGGEAEILEPRVVLIPFGNLTPEIHRIRIDFK